MFASTDKKKGGWSQSIRQVLRLAEAGAGKTAFVVGDVGRKREGLLRPEGYPVLPPRGIAIIVLTGTSFPDHKWSTFIIQQLGRDCIKNRL